MKICNIDLIEDLKARTAAVSAAASLFREVDQEALQYKTSAETWSVLECIAHLNRYYHFYMPLLIEAAGNSQECKGLPFFKPGILGAFFVKLMEPKEEKAKKMKAVAQMDPNGSNPSVEELELFLNYQKDLLSILDISKGYDLRKPQIPTVMSRWITISLGDTFRFIVTHNERHLRQAERCLHQVLVPAD